MLDPSSITRVARRSHRCAGCGLTVHSGEKYVRAQVPGGGRVAKAAFHTKCYASLCAAVDKKA